MGTKTKAAQEMIDEWKQPDYAMPDFAQEMAHTNRIEALRAASRVVAGGISGGVKPMQYGVEASVEEYTLALAEQFARWLEKGE